MPTTPPPTSPRPASAAAAPEIQLQLSIDDVNLVLEAIGNLPFARVFALVGKIQTQAGAQLQAQAGSAAAAPGGQAG